MIHVALRQICCFSLSRIALLFCVYERDRAGKRGGGGLTKAYGRALLCRFFDTVPRDSWQ